MPRNRDNLIPGPPLRAPLSRSATTRAEAAALPADSPRVLDVSVLAASDRCEHRATFEHEGAGNPATSASECSDVNAGPRLAPRLPDSADGVLDGSRSDTEALAEAIEARDLTVTRQPLAALLTDHYGPLAAEGDPFFLVDSPDAIVYRERRPVAVVTESFVSERRREPSSALERSTETERFRAWLGSLLLDHAGFDVRDLRVAVLKHHTSLASDTDHRLEAIRRTAERAGGAPVPTAFGPDGTAVLGPKADSVAFEEPYRRGAYQHFLTDVLDYWRGERPARGPPRPAECGGCAFREACPHALE